MEGGSGKVGNAAHLGDGVDGALASPGGFDVFLGEGGKDVESGAESRAVVRWEFVDGGLEGGQILAGGAGGGGFAIPGPADWGATWDFVEGVAKLTAALFGRGKLAGWVTGAENGCCPANALEGF